MTDDKRDDLGAGNDGSGDCCWSLFGVEKRENPRFDSVGVLGTDEARIDSLDLEQDDRSYSESALRLLSKKNPF